MHKTFNLTEQHLALLRRLTVNRDPEDMHAPMVNQKRPFGNSDIVGDMAEIIGIAPVPTDDGGIYWPPGTTEMCIKLLRELSTALQICLTLGKFEAGEYVTDKWGFAWVGLKEALPY